MGTESLQNGAPDPPKTLQMEPQPLPNQAQMAPGGGQDGQKVVKEHRLSKKERSVPQRPSILSENDANMAPSWPQVGLQSRTKIGKKSMPTSVKNSMPYKVDFLCDFGGFWEEKWKQI